VTYKRDFILTVIILAVCNVRGQLEIAAATAERPIKETYIHAKKPMKKTYSLS